MSPLDILKSPHMFSNCMEKGIHFLYVNVDVKVFHCKRGAWYEIEIIVIISIFGTCIYLIILIYLTLQLSQ